MLADALLEEGCRSLAALDLSKAALDESRHRLSLKGESVLWMEAAVTRAVFHLLTTDDARKVYVEQVLRALKPSGHVITATFGHNGPAECSGLTNHSFLYCM